MLIQRPIRIEDQVRSLLRQRIQEKVYPPGGRLPSESELAQELGVSRATVRTVLARFAKEGLILRKQGDGTYINERLHAIDTHQSGLRDFSRLIEANGYQATIRTISIETRQASPQEAEMLAVPAGSELLFLARLFLADDRPAIFATNVISTGLLKRLDGPFDGQLPIHQFLQTYCQEEIAYLISDIEATLAAGEPGSLLACRENEPLLKIMETFYNKENRPLLLGISYYNYTILKLRLIQAWG